MKILKEIKQPLLSRTKYEVLLEHEKLKTPSKTELKDKIITLLKSQKDLTEVKNVYTKQGLSQSNIITYVYENKQALEGSKRKKKDGKKKNEKQSSK